MKTHRFLFVIAILLILSVPLSAVRVGDTAPDFTATDSNGQSHTLSAYRGKFVVLEWHNRDCPYTHKHYASGNMERLQQKWTARGVEWFTVISSAPGKQGYVTADEENAYLKEVHAVPTAVLLDPEGKVGRLYSAKTTPHMFVIDPTGKLIYDGAIDDKPTTNAADIGSAHNYVDAALTAAMAGQPVEVSATRPYGCSVKYARE